MGHRRDRPHGKFEIEQADPESAIYDSSSVPEFESEMGPMKGMRIVSEHPLIIEYYTDYSTLEAEFIWEFVSDRVGVFTFPATLASTGQTE